MRFDRTKFFDGFRKWRGVVSQQQVEGFNHLLDEIERDGFIKLITWVAYMLATAFHEVAGTMHPIEEYGRGKGRDYSKVYAIKDAAGKILRYVVYFGRGFVQLTWYENYQKCTAALRREYPQLVAEFERRTKQTFNLVSNPEQALDPQLAYAIMSYGMRSGIFRAGHNLSRYLKPNSSDYLFARLIINGIPKGQKLPDRAEKIAEYAKEFEKILRASLISSEVTPQNVDQQIDQLNISNSTITQGDASQDTALSPTPSDVEEPPVSTVAPSVDPAANSNQEPPPPAGDKPTDPPRTWFNVEDWKPRVYGWLRKTWVSFTGFNITNGAANLGAIINSPENWKVYLVIFLVLVFITFIFAAFITTIAVLIWVFNRKEILQLKTAQFHSLIDPNAYNIGLKFERK